MIAVILAGGGGTRLWPLSRGAKPKQFQELVGTKTLLELTRDRLGPDFPDAMVFYSLTAALLPYAQKLFPDVPADHFLVEPEKRDTGPAMGFVAAMMALTHPDEPLAFVPSDHYIKDVERYRTTLRVAEQLIRETGCLVDVGVTPAWPNPHLGYTHIGERRLARDGVDVYAFRGHTEKPSVERAGLFLASGEYLWHANMYMWTPRKFLEAYAQYAPKTYAVLEQIQQHWQRGDQTAVAAAYATLEKISIDYAITEKLDPSRVFIIKAPFDWSDIGQWSVLKQLRQQRDDETVVEGATHIGVKSSNNLVYGPMGKVIATVGVENLIIVDTDDALLVCRGGDDQDIKRIVEELEKRGERGVL